MRACILSMQRINNMGSVLQSYALMRTLEQLGATAEFIDIKKIDSDYQLLGDNRIDYKAEHEGNGLKEKLSKVDKYALNRIKIKKKANVQDSYFGSFRNDILNLNKTSSHYDLCVIGSDEVFNCLSSGWWGFTSQLFGNVQEADRVITYAASCGSTKYQDLPKPVADRIRETFQNVSGFSARDKNTHEFISKLTDMPVNDHLDPVLIYDFLDEVERADLPESSVLSKPYCVIYSYYNRIHDKDEIDGIQRFCKKHDLIPVAIGAPQFWLKNYIPCTPFQCLKIFQNASFVITDTFHGTIFSTKYADRFAVKVRESNRNKLTDLLHKVNEEDHFINDFTELDKAYKVVDDKKNVQEILAKERARTIQYLSQYVK